MAHSLSINYQCCFQVYEHVYETVDIQGNPEVRAKATAKVDAQTFKIKK